MPNTESPTQLALAGFLKRTETIVLFAIAIVLAFLAILLLISSVQTLVNSVIAGTIKDQAIDILDSVLLVMMTMEIVYTVTISIESHTLQAEPFLIVGAIAAIRRMLVITAESTKIENQPLLFQNTLIELGLLAITIVAIAFSISILRRNQQKPEMENQSHESDQSIKSE